MISTIVELPEALRDRLQSFLDEHPDWDQDRAVRAALSLFLKGN